AACATSCPTPKVSCTAAAAARAAVTIRAAVALAAAVPAAAAAAAAAVVGRTPKPRIAITAGDPAGIGPEITAFAAADPRVLAVCEPVVYAPPDLQRFQPGVLSG